MVVLFTETGSVGRGAGLRGKIGVKQAVGYIGLYLPVEVWAGGVNL